MANMLNFKFGQFGSLKDQSYSAGTVYVTTDEQAMYIDLPKSHEPNAEITRVRIGDIIVKESSRDAEPPFSNGAFYYFVEENALLRWNNGEWKQINSVSDVQASIKQVEDTITNTILPKFNNYLLLEGGVMSGDIDMGNKTIKNVLTPVQEADAANKKYVDDGLATKVNVSDFNTFKTANSSAIEEAKKAGTDAQETISKSVLPKFDNYLLLDGGEMKGNITMGTHKITTTSSPSNNNDVTNKQYVDGQVNTRVLSSDFETFKTTNSTAIADAKKEGTEAKELIQNTVLGKFEEYLPLSGGEMSGSIDMGTHKITVSSAPSQTTDLTNKQYVDTEVGKRVLTSDFNTFKTTNSAAIEKAEKAGTDAQTTIQESVLPKFNDYLPLEGGTLEGSINMGGEKITNVSAPINDTDAANKKYVDDGLFTKVNTGDFNTFKTTNSEAIEDAKKAGTDAQATITNTILPKFNNYLLVEGGGMSGDINMNSNKITNVSTPVNNNDAANKSYVDTETGKRVLTSDFNTFKTTNSANIAEAKKAGTDAQSTITNTVLPKFNNYLLLEGGTMDGSINMGNNAITNVPTPTDNNHAVNKKYVDDVIAANDAMTFKGVLGNGTGQIASLPSTANVGDTYKVGVANTYGGNAAKVGDLIINAASKDSDAPNWVHISSGYEDDYLQKIVVDENTIHLTNGVDNTATGSVGGFTIVGDTNSNLVFTVSASTEDPAIHTITASMVWGTFN